MWLTFALAAALCQSGASSFKKIGARRSSPAVAAWAQQLFAAAILFPAAYSQGLTLPMEINFWYAIGISAGINTVTAVLTLFVLRSTPLSLALPMLNLSPIFLIFTAPLITGEYPSWLGILGVGISFIGIYTLGINKNATSALAPIRGLIAYPGVRLMCLVAFLFSVSGPMDKVGLQYSGAIQYAFIFRVILLLILTPYAVLFGNLKQLRQAYVLRGVAPIGIFSGIVGIFQMLAIEIAPVVYIISIKRTSIVWGTIWGWLFFNEENIKQRLTGCIIALVGVVLIGLS